jgi:hypothetical protein
MDRVGVEDPEGEKELIRDEQTDATLNPAAVLTMGQLMMMFMQLQQMQAQMQAQMGQMGVQTPPGAEAQFQEQQASAMNAFRQAGAATGTEMMNGGEMGQLPPEMLPANAQQPGQPGGISPEQQLAQEMMSGGQLPEDVAAALGGE